MEPVSASSQKLRLLRIGGFFLFLIIFLTAVLYFSVRSNYFRQNPNQIAHEIPLPAETTHPSMPNPKIETLITLPPEDPNILYNFYLDPQNHSVVYSVTSYPYTASSSARIVINGTEGKLYYEIDSLTVSPDGKRAAYIASHEEDKKFVVVDGIEGKKYDYIKNLRFSPDGQHIAYAAGEEKYFQPDSKFSGSYMTKTMFIVTDTIEGEKFEGTYADANIFQTYDPVYSKDGKMITYTAIKKGKSTIVSDGKEFSDYPNQQYPQFIGDSYDIVYLASDNNTSFLVVAGQKQKSYDYISDIDDTPIYVGRDASQIAYQVSTKAGESFQYAVVVNDTSYPIVSGGLQNFVFSPSGRNFAYYTGTWMSKDLFVNGINIGTVQPDAATTVGSPLFSPDESLLVYAEYNQKEARGSVHFFSTDTMQEIKEVFLPEFNAIGLLRFSDDGKLLYFKGLENRSIEYVTINIDSLIVESSQDIKSL